MRQPRVSRFLRRCNDTKFASQGKKITKTIIGLKQSVMNPGAFIAEWFLHLPWTPVMCVCWFEPCRGNVQIIISMLFRDLKYLFNLYHSTTYLSIKFWKWAKNCKWTKFEQTFKKCIKSTYSSVEFLEPFVHPHLHSKPLSDERHLMDNII